MKKENTNGGQPDLTEEDDDFHLSDHRRPEMKDRPDLVGDKGIETEQSALQVESFVECYGGCRGVATGATVAGVIA
jgi:hypothetical protein